MAIRTGDLLKLDGLIHIVPSFARIANSLLDVFGHVDWREDARGRPTCMHAVALDRKCRVRLWLGAVAGAGKDVLFHVVHVALGLSDHHWLLTQSYWGCDNRWLEGARAWHLQQGLNSIEPRCQRFQLALVLLSIACFNLLDPLFNLNELSELLSADRHKLLVADIRLVLAHLDID